MRESDIAARLRATTGTSTDLISDADLSLILKEVLDEFVWYRPATKLTAAADALVTVADQPNYDIPSDALYVIEVPWLPGQLGSDDDGILDNLYVQLSTGAWDALHPSELHVLYQRLAECRNFFQGHWKVLNDQIWLAPIPVDSGDNVAIFYAKAKTLDDLKTIRDRPFMWLASGYIWERRAADKLDNGDWRAGSYAVGSAAAVEMARFAERKLKRARSMCANSYGVRTSGPGFPGIRSRD